MATLSPRPDCPWAYSFLTVRLGPCAINLAEERCNMSLVLVQGGGLSQQLNQMPLGGSAMSRVVKLIWAILLQRRRSMADD